MHRIKIKVLCVGESAFFRYLFCLLVSVIVFENYSQVKHIKTKLAKLIYILIHIKFS